MKRCPECGRDYNDETLNFCLDDGAELLFGPKSFDEPQTAILSDPDASADDGLTLLDGPRKEGAVTAILPADNTQTEVARGGSSNPPVNPDEPGSASGNKWIYTSPSGTQIWLGIAMVGLLAAAFFAYRFGSPGGGKSVGEVGASNTVPAELKLYWQMFEAEQRMFVKERALYIEKLIGDEPVDLDTEAVNLIKKEVDDYVGRRDSLSQKPWAEGLRVIFGRASQYASLVTRAYESHNVPAASGLYQAMIESEYRDCPKSPYARGPVGIFQFSRSTAIRYGLTPADYCDVQKQSDAAARYMSDLISDFGEGKSNATLGLMGYSTGEDAVRDWLRQLRAKGIDDRSYWAILRHRDQLVPIPEVTSPPEPLILRGYFNYVPRFFAAAIVGETPEVFNLSTPPLTSIREIP